jgi:hypothetical protein
LVAIPLRGRVPRILFKTGSVHAHKIVLRPASSCAHESTSSY